VGEIVLNEVARWNTFKYFWNGLLVDTKGIHLYLMLIPLAMWSGLSLLKHIQKRSCWICSIWEQAWITHTAWCSVSQVYLLVVQTQWNFWCLALPTCNHTSHHLTTSCSKQKSRRELQQHYLSLNEKHQHYCQSYCVFYVIRVSQSAYTFDQKFHWVYSSDSRKTARN
jgi:hypothetical protein